MKTRQQYLEEYAEQIARYDALIVEAQRFYDAGDFNAGHKPGAEADRLLDYEIIDPIAAELEREGLDVGLADFSAYIKRQALIKAGWQPQPEPEPADIRTDGKLDPFKVISIFSGPAAALMAQWNYETAQDLAPWDYDGGREDFEAFVAATGWSKPVHSSLEELEAAFQAWQQERN